MKMVSFSINESIISLNMGNRVEARIFNNGNGRGSVVMD